MSKAKPPKPAAAGNKPAREQHAHTTGRFNLDRYVPLILASAEAQGNDDDLLNTTQVEEWLGVSHQWLEIGRSKQYGPPYKRLSPTMIRYRRGDIKKWLQHRHHTCTAEYTKKPRLRAVKPKARAVDDTYHQPPKREKN